MCQRCDILEEENRQLKEQIFGREWEPPCELRLTPAEKSMVQAMVKANGRTCSKDLLITVTRNVVRRKWEPEQATINTMICKLRAKLVQHGIKISTTWGEGFYIDPKTRQRLLAWPTQASSSASSPQRAA